MRLRLIVALRLVLAHLAGLVAIGLYGSVGTGPPTLGDFGFFMLMAGAFSLPLLVPLIVAVIIFARWVESHLLAFVLGGPVLVCLGWAALAGTDFLTGIALATGTASLAFAGLALLDWPGRGGSAAAPT